MNYETPQSVEHFSHDGSLLTFSDAFVCVSVARFCPIAASNRDRHRAAVSAQSPSVYIYMIPNDPLGISLFIRHDGGWHVMAIHALSILRHLRQPSVWSQGCFNTGCLHQCHPISVI